MVKYKVQNIDLPESTIEQIEALLYHVAEEFSINDRLKKVGYRSFLACAILFHVKILETDKKDNYSDLELRLLLDTFDKFMRRDVHTRSVVDNIRQRDQQGRPFTLLATNPHPNARQGIDHSANKKLPGLSDDGLMLSPV